MTKIAFTIFPYLELDESVTIGDICFWPYLKEKQKRFGKISNAAQRVDQLVKIYRGFIDNSQLANPVIASRLSDGKDNFAQYDKKVDDELITATNIVAYANLSHQKRFFPSSYENFKSDSYELNLDKTSGGLSLHSRRGIHILMIDETKIQTPFYINVTNVSREVSKDIFSALCTLNERRANGTKDEKLEAERILRSVYWYNRSHVADPLVTSEDMIISLGVALETLLNIQQYSRKGQEMGDRIQLLLGQKKEIANWSDSFYQLRSKIIHGEKVISLDYSFPQSSHITLAQIVFDYCLKTKLHLMKLWPDETPFEVLLWKPIEHYLGSNKHRIERLLNFNVEQLKDREQVLDFRRLSYSLNADTDHSGNKELYKNAVFHIVNIIKQGLSDKLELQKRYGDSIDDFETRLSGLQKMLDSIIGGNLSIIKSLQPVDVVWGQEKPEFHFDVKHIEIGWGMLVSDFYSILQGLFELYEQRDREEKWRKI
ncbi:MAG: hypothetical protein WC734_03795 [Patescibacteria group bacterium]|jgi:hypothetical protein